MAWSVHAQIESLIVVSWTQLAPATAYLEYSFDEGEWLGSPAQELGVGDHQRLLLGVPYETDVVFRVVNDFGDGPLVTEDVTAITGELPADLPSLEILASDPARWEPTGTYLLVTTQVQEQQRQAAV